MSNWKCSSALEAPLASDGQCRRNDHTRKTLKGEVGELPVEIPRDRDRIFEPKLVRAQDPSVQSRR
jgi:transposase-like protein